MEFFPRVLTGRELARRFAEDEVAFAEVVALRFLEIVKRVEEGHEAFFGRAHLREVVAGVNDEDAVKLEARRLRVDVAYAGEKEGG